MHLYPYKRPRRDYDTRTCSSPCRTQRPLRHSIIPDLESLADTALDGLDESIICDNMEALDYFLTSGCPAWDLRAGNNDDALKFIFRHGSDEVIAHVAKHPALRGSPLLHEGMELLVYRCREDLVEVLLAHGGVDINWRNFGGESMLSIAKGGEDWKIVEFLISKGAHK
ncbi:uncharacterized protein APUU_70311S [Aspergillus puulaauensis]|uniref:Ankyrin repeat-containing domain protein n=1 Tax=Aspergillus puulaauensis TaxID=1220207 RepID=A0A7R7XVY0_9EURO|nr:uncharacterized protein APUU_70311S [Aspergillus puulaauensis]BCS28741.1 hypothetical protein APUU_70311S [Aspergillus puulaauensis]